MTIATSTRTKWQIFEGLNATIAPRLFLALAFAIFSFPAFIGLIGRTWQTEAGSLAPIILALGCFTLWQDISSARELARPGRPIVWFTGLAAAISLLVLGSATSMASFGAMAVWIAGVATLYALYGAPVIRQCAFPLGFLALMVPLPYTLSMGANALIRGQVAEWSVSIASLIGIHAALEQGNIIVGPYLLAIENACTGASSTISLVAISLLYAYWVRRQSAVRAWLAGLMAIPVAMAANVGRVVLLMALVKSQGSAVLSTMLHPLSGFISFTLAMALLYLVDHIAVVFLQWRKAQ